MKEFIRKNPVLLLFAATALIVVALSVYSMALVLGATTMLEANTEKWLLAAARSAAALVDADELEAFAAPQDMEKPLYNEIKNRLSAFAAENGLLYAYYVRPEGGRLQFVVDNDFDSETTVSLLSDPVETEPAPQSALGGTAAVAGVGNYSAGWEGILAAYAPVYAADGSIYAIAGVDVSDEDIISARSRVRTMMGFQIAAIIATLLTGFWGMALYRSKAEMAQSANVAKSQFLSRMSHEIRTPMNAIIGLCRMARETDDAALTQRYLGDIANSSNHMLRLIDDILDLSKIESGKIVFDVQATDTAKEIDKLVRIVLPQMKAKGQRLTLDVAENVPPYVMCDCTHVRQIIVNLLSNAMKFTPEGGDISLAVRLRAQRGDECDLEFRVADTGIGIAPQYLHKLFDPFEQGDGSTTRKYGGTGLGLAISKQLVGMMGGDIQVESTPEQGSVFTFNLLLKQASAQDIKAEQAKEPAGTVNLAGRHVLLVEDSDINRLIAENLFTGMGARVDFAENGLEGVAAFKMAPEKYDYIFMDVQMPVMDGYEATRQIRLSGLPRAAAVPIIAMTANVFREDVQRALASGMNGHVGKPFETAQVEQAILQAASG